MLELDNVNSSYGSAKVLFDISLEVEDGSVVSLIGSNGAGKSTLLDCITGHKSYTGTIRYEGNDLSKSEPWEIAELIGYCTEDRNLFGDLSVEKNLKLGGYSRNVDPNEALDDVLSLFPRLDERRTQIANTLSGGEQQMLSIGRSLMANPDFLILDEPSLGLAPTIIDDISEKLKAINDQGVSTLIAEQNVSFALDLSDEVVLLENGQVSEKSRTQNIKNNDELYKSLF